MTQQQTLPEYCDRLAVWVKSQRQLLTAWTFYHSQTQLPAMMAHLYAANAASRRLSEAATTPANASSPPQPSAPSAPSPPTAPSAAAPRQPAGGPREPPAAAGGGGAGEGGGGGNLAELLRAAAGGGGGAAVNVPRLNPNVQEDNIGIQGRRYRIPSPWRRIAAELLDYALLFCFRILCLVLIAGDIRKVFETIDFDFWFVSNSLDRRRLDAALDARPGSSIFGDSSTGGGGVGGASLSGVDFLTTEILVAEVLNRLVVTLFETVCLSRGFGGRLGGSTPGKLIMGLRVVSCAEVYDFVEHVEVLPGENPGLLSAFVRSIIKNFALVFFFPICLTALFFQHNRSTYDIISGTLVVSDMPGTPRRPQQQQNQQQNQR